MSGYRGRMRFEPVLCDFDGTLADSEPVITAALRDACSELEVPIAPEADLRACVGPPLERSIPEVLGMAAPVNDIIAAYRRRYMAVAPTTTSLMPNAQQAIEAWAKHGIRVGIVSYKPLPILEAILGAMGLTTCLAVVRAPEVGSPPDSKTALLKDALEELTPFRAQPVFIGDHADDARAAQEAEVCFIRYPDRSWQEIQGMVLGS